MPSNRDRARSILHVPSTEPAQHGALQIIKNKIVLILPFTSLHLVDSETCPGREGLEWPAGVGIGLTSRA
jgi:hypothetical protein